MKTVQLHDNFLIDGVRRTSDGYLTAMARVARTGIQEYRGYELGGPTSTWCACIAHRKRCSRPMPCAPSRIAPLP
jgi:hypothetical protein